jgi:hypothetical protein
VREPQAGAIQPVEVRLKLVNAFLRARVAKGEALDRAIVDYYTVNRTSFATEIDVLLFGVCRRPFPQESLRQIIGSLCRRATESKKRCGNDKKLFHFT